MRDFNQKLDCVKKSLIKMMKIMKIKSNYIIETINKKENKNMNAKEQMKLEMNGVMICIKHLTETFIKIEALKDSPEPTKTKAQQALWKCLNILGKVEIELDEEISKENN